LACVVYFFSDNSSAALDKIVEKHYALLDASEKIKPANADYWELCQFDNRDNATCEVIYTCLQTSLQ
jgi:hypothetical protein